MTWLRGLMRNPGAWTAAVLVIGMTTGALWVGRPADLTAVLWPAVAIQVALSIGVLPWRDLWGRRTLRTALALYALHLLVATAPLLLLWIAAPDWRTDPIFIGLIALAIVPPSAGLPAYAAAGRVEGRHLAAFTILASVVAPALTPALAATTLGGHADPISLALAVVVTLIAPTAIGLLFGETIRARIPAVVRSVVLTVTLGLTSFSFGQAIASAWGESVPALTLTAAVAVGAARAVAGIVVLGAAAPLLRRRPGDEQRFAVTFKNDALAASLALPVGGAFAVLPAIGSFATSMIVMFVTARRNGRRARE